MNRNLKNSRERDLKFRIRPRMVLTEMISALILAEWISVSLVLRGSERTAALSLKLSEIELVKQYDQGYAGASSG